MCLLKVKEEPYSEPARVKTVRKVRRSSYSLEPLRTARYSNYSNTRIVEDRRQSNYNYPPPPPPPAPPSYTAGPPPDAPLPPPAPPSASYEHVSTRVETKLPSRAPSAVIVETDPPQPPPPASKRTSRAPSIQSPAAASYVEVSHEPDSPRSSLSDIRSHSTRRTSNPAKSASTKRSSVSTPKSAAPAPRSEYSEHEKEIRRERTFSGGPPRRSQPEYETYQYVNAPAGYGEGRRASRGSFGYRSSNERQIVQRDYWR